MIADRLRSLRDHLFTQLNKLVLYSRNTQTWINLLLKQILTSRVLKRLTLWQLRPTKIITACRPIAATFSKLHLFRADREAPLLFLKWTRFRLKQLQVWNKCLTVQITVNQDLLHSFSILKTRIWTLNRFTTNWSIWSKSNILNRNLSIHSIKKRSKNGTEMAKNMNHYQLFNKSQMNLLSTFLLLHLN